MSVLAGRASVPGYLVFYGLWRLIGRGDSSWETLAIIGGALATFVGVFLYSLTLYAPKGQKSWRLALFAFAGFAPWLFACYLVFYKGIWGLIRLWWGFSWWGLAVSLISAWIGYESVKAMDKLSSRELKAALAAEAEGAPGEGPAQTAG